MGHSSIEMVSTDQPRIDEVDDFDEIQVADIGDMDDEIVLPIGSRCSRWCGALFLLLLTALAVAVVDRVYLTPDEDGLATDALSLDEGVGTVDNDGVNERPGTQASINALLRNGSQTSPGTPKSDLQKWLRNHGHVPQGFSGTHQSRGKNTVQYNETHAGQNSDGQGSDGDAEQTLFDKEKWLTSKVTLQDGVMFSIIRELKHDEDAFLEGLTYAQGYLFESTGLNGQSTIRRLDAESGDVLEKYYLEDRTIFAEGLAFAKDKLYQLTYKKERGFIYNVNNISQPIGEFQFASTTGEGWGLTYAPDSNELIMSDGSDFLHMLDPDTMKQTRKIKIVREEGKSAKNINELEYFHGKVLANVWFQDIILVIDPSSGIVEKEYDFSALWPRSERTKAGAEVLNGISISGHPSRLYITGKNWARMFLVE